MTNKNLKNGNLGGITLTLYYSRWHWLQEVIDTNDIVFKTVGSSTLADNCIDLNTMQTKINTIDALQDETISIRAKLIVYCESAIKYEGLVNRSVKILEENTNRIAEWRKGLRS